MKKIYTSLLILFVLSGFSVQAQVSRDTVCAAKFSNPVGNQIDFNGNLSFVGLDSYMNPDGSYCVIIDDTATNYTIKPFYNSNPLNCVSTYDLFFILKHILDDVPITNPYKLIAADVNNDKKITVYDAIDLRRLILYIDTAFNNNTTWRFVDANFTFADPSNPFATNFPECYDVNNLSQNVSFNFVAIRIGDLSPNSNCNGLGGTKTAEDRGLITFQTEDKLLYPGENYRIAFSSENPAALQGMQLELMGDESTMIKALRFNEQVSGSASYHQPDAMHARGLWADATSFDFDADQMIFEAELSVTEPGLLSEKLSVLNGRLSPEVYQAQTGTDQIETIPMQLAFKQTQSEVQLYQNQPNPFTGTTQISFFLPESENIQLNIYDATGKNILTHSATYEKGLNAFDLENQANQAGIYFYELTTQQGSIVKRMMRL